MAAKRILVVGGTGAQGGAVVEALLGADPPFKVRVLSRDPENEHVKEKFPPESGVELVKGSFMDIESVRLALEDCYGLFLNTDGFTVKMSDEIFAAIRIWEISQRIPTLRHFVWSGIDYHLKIGNYDPKYASSHTNAKGRVNDFLQAQASSTSEDGLAWSILNTGAYTDMLAGGVYAPKILPDGTREFAMPLGNGHLPLQTLSDLAAFARIIFEDRARWSGQTLNSFLHWGTGPEIASTLQAVAGVKAVYREVDVEEWIDNTGLRGSPVASTDPEGPKFEESMRLWWNAFRDDILYPTRDREELKRIYPGLHSLEDWMRESGYDGTGKPLLKGLVDLKVGPGFVDGVRQG